MNPDFRKIAKDTTGGRVPADLAAKLRLRATRERRSFSHVLTECVALGLGLDPADYGVQAADQPTAIDTPTSI